MDNNFKIIRKNEFLNSEWSGGTTTELLIYPEESKYSERNFKWRVSSAKVEVDESEFTNLPGIYRILMVLDGEIILKHEGREKIKLKTLQQDSFMGDMKTKSFGKVTDFNLMMSKGCSGSVEALKLKFDNSINIILNKEEKSKLLTDIFYVVNGDVKLIIQNEKYSINEGDLFYLNIEDIEKDYELDIFNESNKDINIIKTRILY